jgi:hypothetical protein
MRIRGKVENLDQLADFVACPKQDLAAQDIHYYGTGRVIVTGGRLH